jgi:hypothetical protein
LPQCTAEFLVLLFYEMGLCGQGANGATPITWQEIYAWNEIADKRLTPWEANMLYEMSCAYVAEIHAGTEMGRPAPYSETDMTVERRKSVASKFRASIEAAKQSR